MYDRGGNQNSNLITGGIRIVTVALYRIMRYVGGNHKTIVSRWRKLLSCERLPSSYEKVRPRSVRQWTKWEEIRVNSALLEKGVVLVQGLQITGCDEANHKSVRLSGKRSRPSPVIMVGGNRNLDNIIGGNQNRERIGRRK
jgi:hypothetical protein